MPTESLDGSYFERKYDESADPWNFATSAYEAHKYAVTLAHLTTPRFGRALEIGCSIGVLTKMLADRCDELVATDINPRALGFARERCAQDGNVRFEQMQVPRVFPSGSFDLVVLSEVGYYWSDDDLTLARDRIAGAAAGGVLELVHYLPDVSDYVRDGDAVHETFLRDDRFRRVRSYREELFRLDVFDVLAVR